MDQCSINVQGFLLNAEVSVQIRLRIAIWAVLGKLFLSFKGIGIVSQMSADVGSFQDAVSLCWAYNNII